jgi:cytochrome d ubiquinol oxidase subunit II
LRDKCDGDVSLRARFIAAVAALNIDFTFYSWQVFVWPLLSDGYRLVYEPDTSGPSNPLFKVVISETGAWLANYQNYKWSIAAPCLAFAGALLAAVLLSRRASKLALSSSSLSVAGVVATAGFSMFPFLMPSSTHPNHSLTIWDLSSSAQTLGIMLVAVVFFLPIILAYTSWVYHVLRGPVTERAIEQGEDYFY